MQELKNKFVSALRWSEKYTKTDMLYLTKGGFWLILGQIVASVSVFITSIAFANLLDPNVFGIYKYIISIVGILSITTLTGMDSAITQSTARGYEGTISLGFKTKIKWSSLGTVMSLLIALYYYSQGNIPFALSFCVAAVFIPFTESFDIYNSFLGGKKLFDIQTLYNVVKKLFALVTIITTIFLTQNIYIILFIYLSSITIPNIFFYYKTIKQYRKNIGVDPEAVGYGKHLSFISIIGVLASEIDKILIFQYVGPVNLVIYSLAIAPTDQIKGLFKNINSLAMPQFSQRTSQEIKKMIWNKTLILLLMTIVVVFVYILLAPLFFKLFFPKYIESVIYSQVLSLSLIPVIISGFLYTILESQKSTKAIYNYNLYTSIMNLVVLFPLIYLFGIWGAIATRIATRIFGLLFVFNTIKKIN